MNARQRQAINEAWAQVNALEPAKHEITRRTTPAMESLRCTCGWSAAESRSQNALGREARLERKIREHAEEIIQRHGEKGKAMKITPEMFGLTKEEVAEFEKQDERISRIRHRHFCKKCGLTWFDNKEVSHDCDCKAENK